MRGTVSGAIAVLAAIVLITNAFPEPTLTLRSLQQATKTSTSTVGTATAIVVIPGFPIESILLGMLLGLVMLILIHQRVK